MVGLAGTSKANALSLCSSTPDPTFVGACLGPLASQLRPLKPHPAFLSVSYMHTSPALAGQSKHKVKTCLCPHFQS
eukprot:1153327-Pelagomonas_calceolata.AAC.1